MTSRICLSPRWACVVICLCLVSICSSVLAEEISGLSVGMYHSCVAYKESGRVKCWGKAPFETSLPHVRIPDFVPGLKDVVQISCGNGHDCAILKNGRVFCWGRNWKGQLGDGTTKDSATPVRVKNLPGKAISVRLGQVHTCALVVVTKKKKKTTKVYCWGLNRYLGAGPNPRTPVGRPRLVKNMDRFTISQLVVNDYHTCVLVEKPKRHARCWGMNSFGSIGNGGIYAEYMLPQVVRNSSSFVGLSEEAHCGIVRPSGLWCWGPRYNKSEAYVTEDSPNVFRYAAPVPNFESFVFHSVHGYHAIVGEPNRKVMSWGENFKGVLGDPAVPERDTLGDVKGLPADATPEGVGRGMNFVCTLMRYANNSQSVFCWGDNTDYKLGNAVMSLPVGSPVQVVNL